MKFSIAILFLFVSLITASHAQDYKIYSTYRQKIVTVDDIITDMNSASVLFIGEEHNDSACHVLESLILSKLNEKYPGRVALSMEMFETDCQEVLDEYLQGIIREKDFITEGRAWPNYKDYRPLIEFAKDHQIPVVAANAPARYVNMVNRMGLASLDQLDKTAKAWLAPLPIDTASGEYYQKFLQVMGGHSAMGGMQMFQAQNLWDATMAWSIAKFYKRHYGFKILQINGGFHSEDKLGAAAQLKKYSPKVKILNIACYSDDSFDSPDWSKYNKSNDYIILSNPKLPKTY
ncbi:MAG: ChaN family lipoprotein [Bacteroidetes bacterium]|nr:ChaN family lipoprotein [Bacteroidota bacterium]